MIKENAVAKINKYGKIGKVITTILSIIAILGAVGTIIAGITLISVPEDLIVFNFGNNAKIEISTEALDPEMTEDDKQKILNAFNSGNGGFNLGAVSFDLDKVEFENGKIVAYSSGDASNVPLKRLGYVVLSAAVALVLTIISLSFGAKLCKSFEQCETPFEDNVIKSMKNFAISLLPWAVYSSIPESMVNSLLSNNINMNLNLDLNVIFTALVIFALSTVFKYGAELQRESDETL